MAIPLKKVLLAKLLREIVCPAEKEFCEVKVIRGLVAVALLAIDHAVIEAVLAGVGLPNTMLVTTGCT